MFPLKKKTNYFHKAPLEKQRYHGLDLKPVRYLERILYEKERNHKTFLLIIIYI